MASFEIFSAAAALRARSETAGTTSPQLKAGRSPPQCCRAPLDALLCREVPKRTNTGRNLSLSAQNSPRTASQRVTLNPHHPKVVIFACAQPRPLTLSRWSAYFARTRPSTGGLWHPSTLPFSNIQPPARCARTGLGKSGKPLQRTRTQPISACRARLEAAHVGSPASGASLEAAAPRGQQQRQAMPS